MIKLDEADGCLGTHEKEMQKLLINPPQHL
jgi:hypothetical protein